MRFYVPLKVFELDVFKNLYASLIEAKLVKDMSANIKYENDICAAKDASIELKHNRLIQERFFKSGIYASSNPLYIWNKDKRVHITSFNNGTEKVKLLEISLVATTPKHVKGLFYIIELSFWKDSAVQQILPWIAQQYNTLSDLNMRVLRLPNIKELIIPALLKLGLVKDAATNTLNAYYIWNGTRSEIYNQLIYLRDNGLKLPVKVGVATERYREDINRHITMTEPQVMQNDKDPEMQSINENSLTVTADNQPSYTPEYIIAKLGRKGAAELAQAILNKLLE